MSWPGRNERCERATFSMKTKFKKTSDIRVSVIGYGGAFHMGREHLKKMRAAGMTPAAVAELDTERLAVATVDYPAIATFSSVAQSRGPVVVEIRRHGGDPTVFLQLGQRFVDEWSNETYRVSPRTRQ